MSISKDSVTITPSYSNDKPPVNENILKTCLHFGSCGGCTWYQIPYNQQKEMKIKALKTALENLTDLIPAEKVNKLDIVFHDLDIPTSGYGFRNRFDFTVQIQNQQTVYGMYSLSDNDKNIKDKTLIDIQSCELLTEDLKKAFHKFRNIKLPLNEFGHLIPKKSGSVRLRCGPQKNIGIWLDFSNEDIKDLFQEKNYLISLLDWAYVEMGQKRKKLIFNSQQNRLQLIEPEFNVWTDYLNENNYTDHMPNPQIQLHGCVGSFTQSGSRFNYFLQQILNSIFLKYQNSIPQMENKKQKINSVLEFGSGIGTLTMILQNHFNKVIACEWDELSLKALTNTIKKHKSNCEIELHHGDFHFKNLNNTDLNNPTNSNQIQTVLKNYDWIVVNPARSGLENFLNPILSSQHGPVNNLLYMSCYLPSFIKDLKNIFELNPDYQIQEIHILDQFPMGPHFEVLAWITQKPIL